MKKDEELFKAKTWDDIEKDNKDFEKIEKIREEYFKKRGLKCDCLVGFVVCENCWNYYFRLNNPIIYRSLIVFDWPKCWIIKLWNWWRNK